MEEELNEQDLEERLYAMLHYVDETQANTTTDQTAIQIIENAPRSTLRRYWRTGGDSNPYQKINTSTEPNNKQLIQNGKQTENTTNKTAVNTKQNESKNVTNTKENENRNVLNTKQNENKTTSTVKQGQDSTKPKEEKSQSPITAIGLSIFQSPPPQNIKKIIEIVDHDIFNEVILESSDEDEVIEVALPPKPTITIESSDDDEMEIVKTNDVVPNKQKQQKKTAERDISTSPVPSVVSSVSDEFIRGDCIALKISSRHSDNHSFDFSLHGADLLDQSTPSKKKKKKKNKQPLTSTPVAQSTAKTASDECFATPKSKAKNKKPKRKTNTVSNNSVPNIDVYDSDSNQSDINKNNSYVVSEKSLPNADVYESDSNQSEIVKEIPCKPSNDLHSSDNSIAVEKPVETLKKSKKNYTTPSDKTHETISVVDLTENDDFVTLDDTGICESIVMGNVSGFTETVDDGDDKVNKIIQKNVSMFGSTKVPAILNEDLDFDNLKGKDKVCKRRRYSLTTLRAEMEKFYNESWGGEDFNHREIQKSMSRDKSLWAIDPKDRMSSFAKKKVTCNYCNRAGHRDDMCRLKPPVCYMCGSTGHFEPRCPSKICVNCGAPNNMYSTMCSNCRHWGSLTCAECGQNGHPASHCPDTWRRYHNTIDNNTVLQRNQHTKKHWHLFCSGCTKRGHLIHTCRTTLPFSGLAINTPYVCFYRPIYPMTYDSENNNPKYKANKSFSQDSMLSYGATPRIDNKRQCKSPATHETHLNKKRNVAEDETPNNNVINTQQRKVSVTEEVVKNVKETSKSVTDASVEKAPDFIPITPTNQDKKGNLIQDNEVSDTSSVVTSSRIYVTNEIIDKINTKEGQQWLKETSEKHDVTIQHGDVHSFLNITGKVANQEAFQTDFRKWAKSKTEKEKEITDHDVSKENQIGLCDLGVLPKNRNHLINTLNKAFKSLQNELGDPNALYKELTFLQNQKQKLLTKKDISLKQVSNNRSNINKLLKALNMVLIGQAGLADGTQHLNELRTLKQKLINSNEILISPEERMEILEHYSSIFGPVYRDDYIELLNKYYISKKSPSIYKKKNKERQIKLNQNTPKNYVISIPSQQINNENEVIIPVNNGTVQGDDKDAHIKKKLLFYHHRLLRSRPSGADLKKRRGELVRRLHSYIASSNMNISSKKMKKIRKIQEQAQMFLANVLTRRCRD